MLACPSSFLAIYTFQVTLFIFLFMVPSGLCKREMEGEDGNAQQICLYGFCCRSQLGCFHCIVADSEEYDVQHIYIWGLCKLSGALTM